MVNLLFILPLLFVSQSNALSLRMSTSSSSPAVVSRSGESYDSMYKALADRAIKLQEKSTSPTGQVFIAMAGTPGSGKSTVAEEVARAINDVKRVPFSVVLPMDGYHITRKELKRMGSLGEIIGDPESTTDGVTTFDDLIARRGSPWTFDHNTFIKDLSKAKETGEAALPTYSREKSDPVPGGAVLTKDQKIVLCEGNYVCAFDSEDWAPLASLWDEKWYIDAPNETILERLINRHLETWTEEKSKMWGEGREGAKAKSEANDFKNALWVEKVSKHHTQLIVANY